jgi:hypothetical protein
MGKASEDRPQIRLLDGGGLEFVFGPIVSIVLQPTAKELNEWSAAIETARQHLRGGSDDDKA